MVSIIIPVYKAEKTLERCLSSILHQSYTDIELLLINDGSPDKSGDICDDYKKKDPRIRVFHQENKGVSCARNKGLEEANGEYICFVDADDWVKPDYVRNLCNGLLDNNKNGLVLQGFDIVNNDGTSLPGRKVSNKVLFSRDFGEAFTNDSICRYGYVCSKLYNKALLNRYAIRFNEQISCCEDLLFMYEYLLHCDYISYGDFQEYVYVKYPMSLSIKVNDFDSEYECFSLYKIYMEQFIEKYSLPIDSLKACYDSMMVCFRRALKSDYQCDRQVRRDIRLSHLHKIVRDNELLISVFYDPVYKIDKVGKYLLLHRCFALYDWWITFLFKLKIKAMFLGPQ